MMAELKGRNVEQRHCAPGMDLDYPEIVTTYRDPYLVGASWANRYSWREVERDWRRQWQAYRDVLKVARVARVDEFTGPPIKFAPDKGAHKAYSLGDMDRYHELVPKELIELALEMSESVRT